jgi:hemin uptake protein HemP
MPIAKECVSRRIKINFVEGVRYAHQTDLRRNADQRSAWVREAGDDVNRVKNKTGVPIDIASAVPFPEAFPRFKEADCFSGRARVVIRHDGGVVPGTLWIIPLGIFRTTTQSTRSVRRASRCLLE